MADRVQLQNAIERLNKAFGEGSVLRLGDEPAPDVRVVSTGAVTLDKALGINGIPRGRITEIYGPEAAGKTTLALHILANVQKAGGDAAIIDVEHALDLKYAAAVGVNTADLLVSQPDTAEQALEIAETLIRAGCECVIVDSVAALVPEKEIEGEMGDMQMGLVARLMSKAMRKLIAPVAEAGTILIFINQLREKIGGYGNPETQPGGRALKYAASIRLDVRRVEGIKAGGNGQPEGNRTRVKVVKNKLASPATQAELDIFFGSGIDFTGSLIDQALIEGVLERSGSWIKFKGENIGQGRDKIRQRLTTDFALHQLIHDAVLGVSQ